MFSAAGVSGLPLAAVRISSQTRSAAPCRFPCLIERFITGLFVARPRLAFVSDIFQLIVGEVLDVSEPANCAPHSHGLPSSSLT